MDILVCLEGSASSASAIGVAIDIARTVRASLVGLAVVDEPDILAASPTSIGGASFRRARDAALLDDAYAHAREWIAGFLARGRSAGVPVRSIELRGLPAELIIAEMQNHDLTLLGRDVNFRFETHEQDDYTRNHILRSAGRPVIVVPDSPLAGSSAVIIMYDGSSAALRALRSFAASGLSRGRDLHVTTVDDDGATAFEIATQGCEVLRREFDLRAEPENIVSAESITAALLAQRHKLAASMIVLGGYVRSPLARMVWGSVTHGILESAAVPVFLHY